MVKQTKIQFNQREVELQTKLKQQDNKINNYLQTRQEIFDFMYSKLNERDKLHVMELNKKQLSTLS